MSSLIKGRYSILLDSQKKELLYQRRNSPLFHSTGTFSLSLSFFCF